MPDYVEIEDLVEIAVKRNAAIIMNKDLSCVGCSKPNKFVMFKFLPEIIPIVGDHSYDGGIAVFVCGNCAVKNDRKDLLNTVETSMRDKTAHVFR